MYSSRLLREISAVVVGPVEAEGLRHVRGGVDDAGCRGVGRRGGHLDAVPIEDGRLRGRVVGDRDMSPLPRREERVPVGRGGADLQRLARPRAHGEEQRIGVRHGRDVEAIAVVCGLVPRDDLFTAHRGVRLQPERERQSGRKELGARTEAEIRVAAELDRLRVGLDAGHIGGSRRGPLVSAQLSGMREGAGVVHSSLELQIEHRCPDTQGLRGRCGSRHPPHGQGHRQHASRPARHPAPGFRPLRHRRHVNPPRRRSAHGRLPTHLSGC